MNSLNKPATIALLLWFIAAIALSGYADYYHHQHAFEGWGPRRYYNDGRGNAGDWEIQGVCSGSL